MNLIKSLLLVLLSFSLFSSYTNAKDINLFDGLIRIKTGDSSNNRYDYDDRNGHYEIIDGERVFVEDPRPTRRHHKNNKEVRGHYEVIHGELVFVEDIDRPTPKNDSHIINSRHRGDWILLTRVMNQDFDWVIIPNTDRKKIKQFLKRGYQISSVSGRKRYCYESGEDKERAWHRYKHLWR